MYNFLASDILSVKYESCDFLVLFCKCWYSVVRFCFWTSLKAFIKVAQVAGEVEVGFEFLEQDGGGEVAFPRRGVWLVAELQEVGQAERQELGLGGKR